MVTDPGAERPAHDHRRLSGDPARLLTAFLYGSLGAHAAGLCVFALFRPALILLPTVPPPTE